MPDPIDKIEIDKSNTPLVNIPINPSDLSIGPIVDNNNLDNYFTEDEIATFKAATYPLKRAKELGPIGLLNQLNILGQKAAISSLDESELGPIKKQIDEHIGELASKTTQLAQSVGIPDDIAQTLGFSIASAPALANELFFPKSATELFALGLMPLSVESLATLKTAVSKGAQESLKISTMTPELEKGITAGISKIIPPITDDIIKQLPKAETPKGLIPDVSQVFKQTVEGLDSIKEQIKSRVAMAELDPEKVIIEKRGETVTQMTLNMLRDRQLDPKDAAEIFNIILKPGEGINELIDRIELASKTGGEILNRFSQMAKYLDNIVGKNPELAERLKMVLYDANNKQLSIARKLWNPIVNTTQKATKLWRSLLVTQIGTSVRNAITQGGRVGIGIIDDGINGAMRSLFKKETPTAAFSNATEDVMAILRRFSPEKRKELSDLIDKFPLQKKELESYLLSDVSPQGKILKGLNILNSTQETFFRRIAFDARLNSNLTRLGKTFDDFKDLINKYPSVSAMPIKEKKIVTSIIDDSVEHALQMTFAASPKSELAKTILKLYNEIPILSIAVNPFPRFWMNALKFTTEFSPLGVLFKTGGSKNPEVAYRAVSRAMTGTMLYSAALVIRNSKFGGKSWYDVITDPDNRPNKTTDIRNFNPFAGMLFVAELGNRIKDVIDGKRTELGFSTGDLANATIALRRTDWTGLPILDALVDQKDDILSSPGKLLKTLKPIMGNFIAGFATPVKNFRDIIEGTYRGGDLEVKSTKESPFWGPLLETLPFARESLPGRPAVTSPGIATRENVAKKQLLGTAEKTKTDVNFELDSLDISIGDFLRPSGSPFADRLIAGKLSELVEGYVRVLMNMPDYKALPIEKKKEIMLDMLKNLKSEATQELREENPIVDLRLTAARLPKKERDMFNKVIDIALERGKDKKLTGKAKTKESKRETVEKEDLLKESAIDLELEKELFSEEE